MIGRRTTVIALLLLAAALSGSERWPAHGQSEPPRARPDVQEIIEKARAASNALNNREAMRLLEAALAKARDLGDRVGEGRAFVNGGNLHRILGNRDLAREWCSRAANIYREIGHTRGQADVLLNLGLVDKDDFKMSDALDKFISALALFRDVKSADGEARALANMGIIYRETGRTEQAVKHFEGALALNQAASDRGAEAETRNGLGLVHQITDMPNAALKEFQEALLLFRDVGNKRGEARALNNIGIVYRDTGYLREAIGYFDRARGMHHASGDKANEGRALNGKGLVYNLMGQPRAAKGYFNQALSLYTASGYVAGQAAALGNLAMTYRKLNRPDDALAYAHKSLALHAGLQDPAGRAHAMNGLGLVYRDTNRPREAMHWFNQALPHFRTAQARGGEASTLANLGTVHHSLGRPKEALTLYQEALALYQGMNFVDGQIDILHGMARTNRSLGLLNEAEAHHTQAIHLVESSRAGLGSSSDMRTKFLASKLFVYYPYLTLLVDRGKTERAFEVTQRIKARALVEMVANGHVDPLLDLSSEERGLVQALRRRADHLNALMMKEGVDNEIGARKRFQAHIAALSETELRLQTLLDSLGARNSEMADDRTAATAKLQDLGKFVPRDAALLEYVQVSRDQAVLFVVTSRQNQAQVKVHRIRGNSAGLQRLCGDFRAACADPRRPTRARARDLYQVLLDPARAEIAGKRQIIICADGSLWDVPFHALMDGRSRPVLASHTVSYGYSATGTLQSLAARKDRPERRAGSVLAFANPDFGQSSRFSTLDGHYASRPFDTPSRPFDTPSRPFDTPSRPFDTPSRELSKLSGQIRGTVQRGRILPLPGTQREADALRNIFPDAVILTGKQAQEDQVKRQAGSYRYLHFASHGFVNDSSPLLSNIVLATPNKGSTDDGFLTAREISEMNLNAEMTVLSACNTARGNYQTGEGVVGLTWALFAAGCPTQVVSMWSVDDRATAQLMVRFYRNLNSGTPKALALREAALSLRRNHRYSHPYYWSPFILLGAWN